MNHEEHPGQGAKPGAIALMIGAWALLDLITPAVLQESDSVEFQTLLAGTIAAQLGLLAIWAVLGPQRLLVRWSTALLVGVLLCGVFFLGTIMADPDSRVVGELTRSALILPLAFLAVQLPLWILRIATGWCIVVSGTQDHSSSMQSRQFRLQHMLAATTVIAVALSLAGQGFPDMGNTDRSADPSMWLRLMFACLMLGVWSAFSTLPCLWAAFVARNKTAGTMIIAVYVVLMSFLVVTLISAIAGSGSVGEGMKHFMPLHGGLVFVLLGGLHIARACGYVLLRPGRKRPPVAPAGSSPFADSSDPLPPASA